MKKYFTVTFMFSLCFAAYLLGDDVKSDNAQVQQEQSERPMLHVETDKTDIYAIPLDLSEEEENQEIKELDSYGKKK